MLVIDYHVWGHAYEHDTNIKGYSFTLIIQVVSNLKIFSSMLHAKCYDAIVQKL